MAKQRGGDDRGCVLQFEVERKRWLGTDKSDFVKSVNYSDETPLVRLRLIARTAMNDVIRNGGTFVLVATDDKITMVQRPEAAWDDEDSEKARDAAIADDASIPQASDGQ